MEKQRKQAEVGRVGVLFSPLTVSRSGEKSSGVGLHPL